MCQVCLFLPDSLLSTATLWFVNGLLVHVQEWDIVILVLVTCSEAVNDWEISGIIRPITAGITQSSNLRRQTSKLRDIDNLSGKQPICPTSTKMTGWSMLWLEHGETQHFLHQNMKSPFFRSDKNKEMRIFGELITDSEIFCLGWKISTFPKSLWAPQGCRQVQVPTADRGQGALADNFRGKDNERLIIRDEIFK